MRETDNGLGHKQLTSKLTNNDTMHGINMTNQKLNQWHVHLHTINFRHLLLFVIGHFLRSLASAPPSHLRLAKEKSASVVAAKECIHPHSITHSLMGTHALTSFPHLDHSTHSLTYALHSHAQP